jgi:hypothetical protein
MIGLAYSSYRWVEKPLRAASWSAQPVYSFLYGAIGVTSIVLMAQVANVDPSASHTITFSHHRRFRVLPDAQGNNAQAPNITTELVKEFVIPGSDAGTMITGKMIIESQDSIRCFSNDPTGKMKLVLSVLETANT